MNRIIVTLVIFLTITSAVVSETAEGLKAGDVDPKSGKVIKYWAAPMDPTYIRNQPGQSPMGMDLVPVFEEEGEKLPASTIRIDPVTIQNMGVRTARVAKMELKKSIRALGTITYDETRIYAVNLKFDGWIEKLYVNFVGESVKKGQPLFDIYSPELVAAQEEYLLAVKQSENLSDSRYSSVQENAAGLLKAARRRLQYWDLSAGQIGRLTKNRKVEKSLTVYSPATGVVIRKEPFDGHFAKAGMHQYEIADLSRIWVDVEVYEYELPFIRQGMSVDMELSYLPGNRFEGTVLFIYPFLNPETRTAKLRLAFDNQEGLLKPDMYANVFLESIIDPDALVIPQEAVIDSGIRKIVFIAKDEGKFEPREIKLGHEGMDNLFQVLGGLSAGERVVTSAQFMLDSESRLREAIQKMLEIRNTGSQDSPGAADDLDMEGMGMDDDLDMSDMKMDQ